MPSRVQMTRNKPWRADHPDAVIVARPSKWGNPWRVQKHSVYMTAAVVVDMYRTALVAGELPYTVEDVRRELAGHDLACWCPLDQACHASVLLELANA